MAGVLDSFIILVLKMAEKTCGARRIAAMVLSSRAGLPRNPCVLPNHCREPVSMSLLMTPIVEYPTEATSSLLAFKDVFSRPQMENFASYFTGLMVSPDRTISQIDDAFYAHKDQSALNHFHTEARRIASMAFS